jgi:hypothetical protein
MGNGASPTLLMVGVEDGRLYPETKGNDQYFDTEAEALDEYLNRVVPGRRERDKED